VIIDTVRKKWSLYALLLSLVTLLSIAFTVLRSARSAVVVADVGGSATLIPYYELLGTMPMAIVLSWLLAYLLRRFSLPTVFKATMIGFLLFFGVYAAIVYPFWRGYVPQALRSNSIGSMAIVHLPTLLFFAVAELWKVGLLSILLWSYINRNMMLAHAKVIYAPIMFGSSLGAILAQPLTTACSRSVVLDRFSVDHWHAVLSTQLLVVMVLGLVILVLFQLLVYQFGFVQQADVEETVSDKLTLSSSLKHSWNSLHLRSLAWIVILDYLVYSLVEVVFLAKLKELHTDPTAYCEAMAQLALWGGVMTAIAALLLGPQLLKRLPWYVTALATPVMAAPVVVLFLGVIMLQEYGWLSEAEGLKYAIWSGSLFFCLGRATKYALLDSAKELAFIPLPKHEQLQGKLAIEALASRGGRGAASLLTIVLFGLSGSIVASVPAAFFIALGAIGVWTRATVVVGNSMETLRSRGDYVRTPPVDPALVT
jgi:AAA family ATP:ADP antiporter